MSFKLLGITFLLATLSSAKPVPQIWSCYTTESYTVDSVSDPHDNDPVRATGVRCDSLKTESCTITPSISFQKTVTYEVSGTANVGLDLGEIWNIGLGAGFSTSWSTTTGVAVSADLNCPPGPMTCSARVITKTRTITGVKITSAPDFCGVPEKREPYTIESPALDESAPEGIQAIMDFSACLTKCDFEGCQAATAAGIPPCP